MDIIELIKAAIIGIIEGITEWLPISSTGHMIIADEFIKLDVSEAFWEMFLVVIQLGAILAVIALYFNKLNPFAPSKGKAGRRKTWNLWAKVIVACIPAAIIGILLDDWFEEHFHNAITVAIALIVYGVAFIVIERIKGPEKPAVSSVKASQAPQRKAGHSKGRHSADAIAARGDMSPSALQVSLPQTTASRKREEQGETTRGEIAQGETTRGENARGEITRGEIAQGETVRGETGSGEPDSRELAREKKPRQQTYKRKHEPAKGANAVSDVDDLGFGRALGIGVFQCLAIVPGTSRSGSTILGGRILGVSRAAAAEFSFFLAIPVMFGWSLLKIVKGFILDDLTLTTTEWGVFVVGIVVAFVVSILAIKFLMSFIRNHSFEVFGWYRIVLGIVVLAFFAITGQLFIMQ